jgi:hypothetical protein
MRSFINNLSFPKAVTVVLLIIFTIPFVVYALYIFIYAVNIPFQDDYLAVLNFMNTFTQIHSLREKIILLFSQHNEHRIVFDRIVFLCCYYLFHEVNFKYFIIFGNLGWMLTTVMLIVYLRKNYHLSLAHLLPVPYLLLSFNHWENMFFAMAAIQNYWFVFFSLAFLICLSRGKTCLFCALFPIVLFTSGGGIVLYPLGNLFLLLQKKWKSFASFLLISTSCMIFYFYDYYKPPNHPKILEAVLTPFSTITYLFSFWGNILPFPSPNIITTTIFPFLIGIILFLLSAYIVVKRKGDHFWQLVMCFIFLVALTTTLTRSGLGIWQASSSRYSMFPLLTLLCIYIFMVTSISVAFNTRRIILLSAVVCTMYYWVIGVVYFERTRYFLKMKDERIASIIAFNRGNKAALLSTDKDQAAQILLISEQQHIYHYRE